MFQKAISALGIPGMPQASIDKMFNELADLQAQRMSHAVSITLIDNMFKAFNRFQRMPIAPRTVQESILEAFACDDRYIQEKITQLRPMDLTNVVAMFSEFTDFSHYYNAEDVYALGLDYTTGKDEFDVNRFMNDLNLVKGSVRPKPNWEGLHRKTGSAGINQLMPGSNSSNTRAGNQKSNKKPPSFRGFHDQKTISDIIKATYSLDKTVYDYFNKNGGKLSSADFATCI